MTTPNSNGLQARIWAQVNAATVILILILSVQGCARENPQLSDHFNAIKMGDAKETLISRMGPPKEREYSSVLGLSHETLSWHDGPKNYTVVLVNDLVIAKSLSRCKKERPG